MGVTIAKEGSNDSSTIGGNFINSSTNRFKFLNNLTKLSTLQLDRCPVLIDSDLEQVGKLSNLTHLQLQGTLTDCGLEHLSNLNRLTKLTITSCKITCKGVASISKIKSLNRLSFHYARISVYGLKSLYLLSNLQSLSLDYLQLCDSSVLTIMNFPSSLHELHLSRVQLSKQAAQALTQQHKFAVDLQGVCIA